MIRFTRYTGEKIVAAQGKYRKWGPYYRLLEGVWGHAPRKCLKILHALKCVLGASGDPFCIYIQYKHTCQLPSSFSGFGLKSMTYGTLSLVLFMKMQSGNETMGP